eukprot:UN29621
MIIKTGNVNLNMCRNTIKKKNSFSLILEDSSQSSNVDCSSSNSTSNSTESSNTSTNSNSTSNSNSTRNTSTSETTTTTTTSTTENSSSLGDSSSSSTPIIDKLRRTQSQLDTINKSKPLD